MIRDKTYGGLANSKIPYPMVSKELKLQESAPYMPFFQTFIDYRMGQRKRMPLGPGCALEFLEFDLNLPYDVYLDIIDEPDFDGLHHFFLRQALFDEDGAVVLARSYETLIKRFAQNPGLTVGEVELDA
ncbi:hypothetical protein QQS21_004388 [Conoideocrella luteorostrata]|uniref:Uncharacterized protein n=1 Tax=Conoideocrella luteorostrata TaxID=1105319 RepID=A0AAJ0CUD2_9HYPO|nr:hypothetical protein QQS21_004388 [Conoideocrella luteorostrata]